MREKGGSGRERGNREGETGSTERGCDYAFPACGPPVSGRASCAAHAPRSPPARDGGRSCALPPARGCVRTKPAVHSSRNDEAPLAGRHSLAPPALRSYARLSTSSLADRSSSSLGLFLSLSFSHAHSSPTVAIRGDRRRSRGSRRRRALSSTVAVYRLDTRASLSVSGRVLMKRCFECDEGVDSFRGRGWAASVFRRSKWTLDQREDSRG